MRGAFIAFIQEVIGNHWRRGRDSNTRCADMYPVSVSVEKASGFSGVPSLIIHKGDMHRD
jgi:hypothetical protein